MYMYEEIITHIINRKLHLIFLLYAITPFQYFMYEVQQVLYI